MPRNSILYTWKYVLYGSKHFSKTNCKLVKYFAVVSDSKQWYDIIIRIFQIPILKALLSVVLQMFCQTKHIKSTVVQYLY